MHAWIFLSNRLTSVEISGTKYRQNDIVVCFYEHNEPLFSRIIYFIATASQEYYFVLDLLETAGFSEHFHAYRFSFAGSESDVCVQTDLVNYHPRYLIVQYCSPLLD